jgi:hypothetical protein
VGRAGPANRPPSCVATPRGRRPRGLRPQSPSTRTRPAQTDVVSWYPFVARYPLVATRQKVTKQRWRRPAWIDHPGRTDPVGRDRVSRHDPNVVGHATPTIRNPPRAVAELADALFDPHLGDKVRSPYDRRPAATAGAFAASNEKNHRPGRPSGPLTRSGHWSQGKWSPRVAPARSVGGPACRRPAIPPAHAPPRTAPVAGVESIVGLPRSGSPSA